jgi:hypothetical protein
MTQFSRLLGGLLLLSALLGCGSSPKINDAALREGEALGKEASALYEKAQTDISLANKYTWQAWVDVRSAKDRDQQLTATAKELEAVRDKFAAASSKMKEALNGQKPFDSNEAKHASKMSEAYRQWSEMVEFERKTWQESVGVADAKALNDKLTDATNKYKKMNEDVMASIKAAS